MMWGWIVTLCVGSGLVAAGADAALVCQKKSGAMFVRAACKKKETPVDLGTLGALGPKGDKGDTGEPGQARAYACSETSDEASASLCANKAVKGVTSVVANTTYPGYTCFVLDSSIDAESAVVLAALNGGLFGGGKANTIISAFGSSNFLGCPMNSVVVITGRHTNDTTFLGLEFAILGVNIAVM